MATTLAVFLTVVQLGELPHSAAADDYLRPHNDARAKVRVPPLTWSDTLAAFAQSHSDRLAADSCAHRTYSGGPYAESIFWNGDASSTAADAVADWVAGGRGYDYDTNSCRTGDCREYLHVVWRNTTSLGCAKAACRGGGGGRVVMVCEYDPPGVIAGQRPY